MPCRMLSNVARNVIKEGGTESSLSVLFWFSVVQLNSFSISPLGTHDVRLVKERFSDCRMF